MAVLDSSDCSTLTGWTAVDPGAAADVTAAAGVIHYYKLDSTYGGSFNEVGLYRTTGTAGAIGHVIYAQVKLTLASECMLITLSKSAQVNYQNMVSAYFEGGNKISMFDGATQRGNFAASSATWYDLKFEIVSGGKVDLYARASDTPGSFNPSSSAWTLVANGVTVTNYHSSTIYVASDMGSAVALSTSGFYMDEFYYTDNGSISPTGGGDGGSSSNFILLGDF